MELKIIAPMIVNGDDYDLPDFAQFALKHTLPGDSAETFVKLVELSSNKRFPSLYRIWVAEINEASIANIESLPDTLILPDTGDGNSDAAKVFYFISTRVSKEDFIGYAKAIREYSPRASALIDAVEAMYK